MKNILLKITTASFIALTACSLLFLNACEKDAGIPEKNKGFVENCYLTPEQMGATVQILSLANILTTPEGSHKIMFNKNAQVMGVSDPAVLAVLQKAFAAHSYLSVTFNPWKAMVIGATELSAEENEKHAPVRSTFTGGKVIKMSELGSVEEIDNVERLGVINTTSPGTLTNVVPDFATAQLMFTYLTKQCCALPGPYGVDYCISFQYAPDGCYARAHKMCYTINTKYHYSTNKIFSFANAGWDQLSVQAQKWGGCCVNWWYHVAPLVNVQTPTGVKAFVFDPAMFDQPVLLSVWLHAQENPVCVSWATPNVSMINVQPTASYAPADYSGFAFVTDPTYSDSNSTLVAYSNLTTCP